MSTRITPDGRRLPDPDADTLICAPGLACAEGCAYVRHGEPCPIWGAVGPRVPLDPATSASDAYAQAREVRR